MADTGRPAQDPWAEWVLKNCGGQDPQRLLEKVLQHAQISEGETVLDVGAGAGLIGFAALPLVGQWGKVIFSDISTPLLDNCRATAQALGALDRCQFLHAPAEDLSALVDASVDVVIV